MDISHSPSNQAQELLMSIGEVADRLGAESSIVLRAVARGDLPSIRIRDNVWIERAAFERILATVYANYGPEKRS